MESWRKAWREGIVPFLGTPGLESLLQALIKDDLRLLQGQTSEPPALLCVAGNPIKGACAIGYCGASEMGGFDGSEHPASVSEVHEFFGSVCCQAGALLGDPLACSWFLYFWDETDRQELRRLMVYEVNRELARRQDQNNTVPFST